jgi:hypothetical protein
MDTSSIMIGAGIGAVIGTIYVLRMFGWQRKLVAKVDAGDLAGARKLLQQHAKAVAPSRSFSNMKLLPQRARVLGLWLIGDVREVAAELAMHGGGPTYLANVHMFGTLALATEPGADVPALVADLEQSAARVNTEANALQKLLKDYATMLAAAGAGLAGRQVDPALARKLIGKVGNEPVLTRILVLRVLLLAAERAGAPSSQLHTQLRTLTRRWAPGARAA